MCGIDDFLGRRIKPGDTIAYPVRRGSDMWMTWIQVTSIDTAPVTIVGLNSMGRQITLKSAERVVRVGD
jgi:hypothetical protein